MSDQLAKIIASTLTEQDPEHGLSDAQVAAFLAAFEQKASTSSKATQQAVNWMGLCMLKLA